MKAIFNENVPTSRDAFLIFPQKAVISAG
jgi:hypothetical protein